MAFRSGVRLLGGGLALWSRGIILMHYNFDLKLMGVATKTGIVEQFPHVLQMCPSFLIPKLLAIMNYAYV